MSKMTIMMGLPASGKSTKAQEILKDGNTVRINKDLLRTMLHFDNFTGRNEGMTKDVARNLAQHFLTNGTNVVIDDTNLNTGTRQGWVDLARALGAKIEYADMTDVPVETCIERDATREKKVGKHVIQKMALQNLDYMKGQEIIICDLDGTLCDITHRLPHVKKEPKDWKEFFRLIPEDTIRTVTVNCIRYQTEEHPDAKLFFVSGRPNDHREETEQWLVNHHVDNYTVLLMRESGDKRPDTEVKAEIFDKYLKNLKIVAVLDDRPSVIRMWREKGLYVIDMGNGVEF